MTAKVKKTIIRLLLTYLAVLIIPILISVFVFRSAYQVIETSIKATTAASLQQAGIALEQRVSEIETMTYELYQNNELIRFGINTSGMKGETPSKLLELQNNLPNYSVSNKFILDYFILFPNSEIVLNNKIAYTYENFFQYYLNYDNIDLDTWRHWSDQDNYPKILPNQSIQMLDKTGSSAINTSDTQKRSVVTFLMKSGKSYSTRMYIMILVDGQEFYNLVRGNLHTNSDYLRIMDTQGNFLYEAGAEEIYHQYELLDNLQKEDSFYHLSEQQDLFVSNHYSQALGWNILSIRPYGDVMTNLNHVNRNVRIFIILSFLIGIASAVLFTVRKNTPVMSLLLDNHTLQEKMEQQKPFLLNTFLERLLLGRLKEPEVQQIASYLQFPMLSNYQCAIIHFFDMQQGLEQLEQVKLVFSNMLEKNMDAPCYCHDIGSDKLACIFGGGTAFSGKNAAQSWADLVHQSGLKGRCKIAVSLSESCGQLNDIGIAAQEALHALDYKDWDQDFQLLHAEEYDSAIGIVQEKKIYKN